MSFTNPVATSSQKSKLSRPPRLTIQMVMAPVSSLGNDLCSMVHVTETARLKRDAVAGADIALSTPAGTAK